MEAQTELKVSHFLGFSSRGERGAFGCCFIVASLCVFLPAGPLKCHVVLWRLLVDALYLDKLGCWREGNCAHLDLAFTCACAVLGFACALLL
jgi:hypothetical protein